MRLGSTEGEVIPWDYDADMVLVLPLERVGASTVGVVADDVCNLGVWGVGVRV